MRKIRAIVLDDDASIRSMLTRFFVMRGYEALAAGEPGEVCGAGGCGRSLCGVGGACSDILITDINMPGVNGIELVEHQVRSGCRLDIRNKALISGDVDPESEERMRLLACCFIKKPFTVGELSAWLDGCERRLDLSVPLFTRRREERFDNRREITFNCPTSDEARTGLVVNVSPSGLCLKVDAPLQQEQTLHIQGSHFPSGQPVSVRWVRQVSKDTFLVGVHCGSAVHTGGAG